MLRAALLDAAPSKAVVGMDKSKPASPAPAVITVPAAAAVLKGKMIGQLFPVACPMDWEMALVGVVGV